MTRFLSIAVSSTGTRRRLIGAAGVLASAALFAACDATAELCSSPVNVPSTGTYCGVDTQITPWARADGPWDDATFQSDAGHGESRDIRIIFERPVSRVEISAYDPTFSGNAMYAYDAVGRLVGSANFPGNGTPGALTVQTRSVSGGISEVKLVAAAADYVNYSMRVRYTGATTHFVEAKEPQKAPALSRIRSESKRSG